MLDSFRHTHGMAVAAVILLGVIVRDVVGFTCIPQKISHISIRRSVQPAQSRVYSLNDDNDLEDDDEDDIDLGDWRKFRANLIDGGLPTDETTTTEEAAEKPSKKRSVSKQNELLLEQQNSKLAEEYRTGVWAHVTSEPEIGGLLCRMPIEAEFYYGAKGYWKNKMNLLLMKVENNDKDSDSDEKESDSDEEESDTITYERVNDWFQAAEKMLTQELELIQSSGSIKNGVLNPNDLEKNSRYMLDKYVDYKQTWQEVCLVLSHYPESGCGEAIILNRPIAKSMDQSLAQVLIEGNDAESEKNAIFYDNKFSLMNKMVEAFGKEAAIYFGGPDEQLEPALLIHGIADLEGAEEIAPGTGIYKGGLEAAINGVLDGIYQALDFRFFVGRKIYNPQTFPENGTLLQKVEQAIYKPMACARSVALKQCLGLPKPLWHEVLELCGGEMKSLSSIELEKRVDLD